jgi:serine/threonine protein kinase
MDYAGRLALSYYHTIATINDAHKIYLVQHRETHKIYVKKILDIYNLHIYKYLQNHRITGIPKLYDIYEENEHLTIVEEFISGTSLQEIIDSHALSISFIIQIMCELCDILEQLHGLNPPIIHRDIKPSNIIITPYEHVVLIDFNAAKYLTCQNETDTVLLGTRGYAAPEQYGFGSSTPQTDIYALGILLKELVAALPVATDKFDAIISSCTQINPSDRMKSVSQLKAEIMRHKTHDTSKMQPVKCAAWQDYLPPGFRAKTPWKMLTASVIYIFIVWLCLSMTFESETLIQLWLQRVFCLFMMLSVIFCCFNYRNIQRFVPLCKSPHRVIRYFGILILTTVMILLLFFVMMMLL